MLAETSSASTMRMRIPLYAAGYGVCFVALSTISALETSKHLVLVCSTLTALGFCVSWAIRWRILARSTVLLVALASTSAAIIIFERTWVDLGILRVDFADRGEWAICLALAGIIVFESFALLSDKAVLFLCVPALSLVTLTAPFGTSVQISTRFAIYLALTCFLLIQQNRLAQVDSSPTVSNQVRLPVLLGWHIIVSLMVTTTAMLLGVGVTKHIYPSFDNVLVSQLIEPAIGPAIPRLLDENFVPVATGPVSLDDRIVMTVQCEGEHLWRGQTFNMYTGQGWSIDLPDEERRIFYPSGYSYTDAAGEMQYSREQAPTYYIEHLVQHEQRARVQRVKQRFRILTYERTNTLFAAAEPITIRGNVRGPIVRVGGGYRCGEYYGWGTSYEVDSLVVKAAPCELRTAGTNIPKSIRETYLTVPQSCWQVAELVRQITLGKYTAFDKARAIEDYLEQHYIYDLRAPATPRTQDAVTFFLLKSKKGYCDLFASAMVIMARQAGIPARWVTGYAPGQYDESKQMFIVRGIDAHAWAELYFPGYGWIEFDPTPSSAPQAGLLSRVRVTWQRFKSAIVTERKAAAAVLLLLVLLAYILRIEILDGFGWVKSKRRQSFTAIGARGGVYYYKMCMLLAKAGHPKRPALTPLEYADEISLSFGSELEDALE
ncbi:MAG: DUF3488 and transglutaminase-like domain-containing protein, partial [Armatimonadetes bacterium]|nr:DUF3488 and transglutaminase-like domain-containing protein [Armatimonadota bacterium]